MSSSNFGFGSSGNSNGLAEARGPLSAFFLVVVAISVIEAFSQASLKEGQLSGNLKWVIFGSLGYAVIGVLLWVCYRKSGRLNQVNVTWNTLSMIFIALTGWFLYGEKLGKRECIGFLFALLAIYFTNF